jgi:hypothetical protein
MCDLKVMTGWVPISFLCLHGICLRPETANVMVTIRCTKKLLKFLNVVPDESSKPPTGALGDWYANLVPTIAGTLIIFVNERSLLTVAVPEWEVQNLVPSFRIRVVNLLGMIGVPAEAAGRELRHLDHVHFGKTVSRTVIGSMNEIAFQYQAMAEEGKGKGKGKLSLSEAEERLSRLVCGPLGCLYPAEVAKALLQGKMGSA